MNDYFLTLAGLSIVLRTPHPITVAARMRPFLTEPQSAPDCTITLQVSPVLPSPARDGIWHGLEYYDHKNNAMRVFHYRSPREAAFAVTQHLENGNILMEILPDFLSYFSGSSGIFNRIGMETLLLQHNGLLLHASLIKYKNKAIAFSGPSGVGKSTQADIWRTCLGADIINGDRAALRKEKDGWTAFGSPYAGTSGIYKNDQAPLAAIILLKQAEENNLRQLNVTEAFRHIYQELSVHHWDKGFVSKAADLCLQLLTETPVYLLECRPDEDAALLVKKGLEL